MVQITQDTIDALIIAIKDAETAGAISNEMVGEILDWINTSQKQVAEVPAKLQKETLDRASADAALKNSLDALTERVTNVASISTENKNTISTLLGKNASSTIESFNEIISFLEGVSDSEKLVSKLQEIKTSIKNAVDRIKATEDNISAAEENLELLQREVDSVDDKAGEALRNAATAKENAGTALSFAQTAAQTAAATSEAVNTVNAHTTQIADIKRRLSDLESDSVFEELQSEAEWQQRDQAGTLAPGILYYVPES